MELQLAAVTIPCPQCNAAETIVVYRHFEHAALMCRACEYTWEMMVASHPTLSAMKPFYPH